MYNRQKKKVMVQTNTGQRDQYGYKKDFADARTANVAIMLYEQKNVSDVRYKEVTHTGLTSDKTMDDSMRLRDGDKIYNILLVNNAGRLAQLMLKEVR